MESLVTNTLRNPGLVVRGESDTKQREPAARKQPCGCSSEARKFNWQSRAFSTLSSSVSNLIFGTRLFVPLFASTAATFLAPEFTSRRQARERCRHSN